MTDATLLGIIAASVRIPLTEPGTDTGGTAGGTSTGGDTGSEGATDTGGSNGWRTIWEADVAGRSSTNSGAGDAHRNRISYEELANTGLREIRVTFAAATNVTPNEGFEVVDGSVSIGNKNMEGEAFEQSSQTFLTFNGGDTGFFIPYQEELVSDPVVFEFDIGCDVIVVFRVGGTLQDSFETVAGPGIHFTWRNGNFIGPDDNASFLNGDNVGGTAVVKIEGRFGPQARGTDDLYSGNFGDGNYWAGDTVRARVDASVIQRSGSKIRLKFSTPDAGCIEKCYIAPAALSGDVIDAASAFTQVTFDGGNSASGTPVNGRVISDWVDYDLDRTEDLLISCHIGSGKNITIWNLGTRPEGWEIYVRFDIDEATTLDVSGGAYTFSTTHGLFSGFDVWDENYEDDFGETPTEEEPTDSEEPEPDPEPEQPSEEGWVEMVAPATPWRSANGGFAGRTFRNCIRASKILAEGNTVKLVFYGGIGGFDIEACTIGEGVNVSGRYLQFAEVPTVVTFNGGSPSVEIGPGEYKESDPISFNVSDDENVVIAYQTSSDRPFILLGGGMFGGYTIEAIDDTQGVPGAYYSAGDLKGAFNAGLAKVYVTTEVIVGAHQYWRILVSDNNGSGFTSIGSELAMYNSNDGTGTNLSRSGEGTISASSGGVFGNVTANLLDGNAGTQWAVAETGADWVQFLFDDPVAINSIRMTLSSAGGQESLMAKDFKVQSSDDGSSWTDEWTVTGEDWTSGATDRVYGRP